MATGPWCFTLKMNRSCAANTTYSRPASSRPRRIIPAETRPSPGWRSRRGRVLLMTLVMVRPVGVSTACSRAPTASARWSRQLVAPASSIMWEMASVVIVLSEYVSVSVGVWAG